MTPPRTRPPGVSDERTQLVGWFDLQRALVHYKCTGLSEEDAHRSLLPTSPAMTVAGLVSHLRWVEHCWFEVLFLDHPASGNPQFGPVEDADFQVGDASLSELLDEYARQCAVSNEIVAASSLDAHGQNRDYGADGLNLRWMLIHVVEEVARHVGHLDVIREQLDGVKGYYRGRPQGGCCSTPPARSPSSRHRVGGAGTRAGLCRMAARPLQRGCSTGPGRRRAARTSRPAVRPAGRADLPRAALSRRRPPGRPPTTACGRRRWCRRGDRCASRTGRAGPG